MRMPRDARILFCMSAKASYIRLDFRVSSSARISLGNQYPRVSPLPLTLLSLLPPSHTRPSPCLLPLASRIAPRDSRLRAPLLDNLSTRSPTAPPTPVPPPPLALSSIFSPSLPPHPPPFPLPSAPLVRPGPSPLCPPPFLPTRGGYPSSPGRNPLPLSISAAPSSTSIPLLHRASSTRHPSLINVI